MGLKYIESLNINRPALYLLKWTFYYSVGVGPCAYEYTTVALFYSFVILTKNHYEVSDTDTQCMGKDERRRGILDHLRQFD